jgi:predicted acyl esterase
MTFYPGEFLRFMVSSQNITGNVHPGVPAYVSKDNHGKHIIHCGGEYQSYLQIGILK